MKRIVWGALAALSLPVAASSTEFSSNGFWTVYQKPSDCFLAAEYENNSTLLLSYDYRLKSVYVIFTDPSVKTLKPSDTRSLSLYLINKKTNKMDSDWGSTDFVVTITDGITHFGSKFDEQILTDVASNDVLAFGYKDIILQSYNLEGSGVAIANLRQCAKKASHEHPSDPFAGEK